MTIYEAVFSNGTTITKTSKEFKNRLDFYNWICMNRLGLKYGKLLRIDCRFLPDVDNSYPF